MCLSGTLTLGKIAMATFSDAFNQEIIGRKQKSDLGFGGMLLRFTGSMVNV